MDATLPRTPSNRARLIAAWGVVGVTILFGQAIARMAPIAIEPWIERQMNAWQMALYIAWLGFNGYAEGYRAFQKKWCPRVVKRAFHLGRHPKALRVLLAPFFCMSLFHSTRRGLTVAWSVVSLVVVAVVLVRQLPQPWRGIVDGGVVLGLGWGLVVLWGLFARAFAEGAEPPEDLPPTAGPA